MQQHKLSCSVIILYHLLRLHTFPFPALFLYIPSLLLNLSVHDCELSFAKLFPSFSYFHLPFLKLTPIFSSQFHPLFNQLQLILPLLPLPFFLKILCLTSPIPSAFQLQLIIVYLLFRTFAFVFETYAGFSSLLYPLFRIYHFLLNAIALHPSCSDDVIPNHLKLMNYS